MQNGIYRERENQYTDVYCCKIDEMHLLEGYEGIKNVVLMSKKQLEEAIHAGEITDGFILAAYRG